MTALTHTSRIVSLDVEGGHAVIEYTPSVDGLPIITKELSIPLPVTDRFRDITIAVNAPVKEWFEIRPDLRPVSPPQPWLITPSSPISPNPLDPPVSITPIAPQEPA